FGKMLEQKQEAEQKQLHLLQILETERRAKWHYVKQIEDLTAEVKKLKSEVQSFFRGWLCRRRWKQIVEDYIRSEHAESMRRRNSIVFGLVECEDEYVQQLSILVTCYLRPFRMAASSKKPIILHEDVNSIFLNVETVLFLHQFFVQGLRNKMENWPTLQLGDLFDLFLPMVGIYQEYVRNHHYSLQVLAEYKQRQEFTQMLKRLEEKPIETENIRKNLAIERMIVDGCELLLDVNQVFVRQGTLIQVICDKPRSSRSRLGNFGGSAREKKEAVRQVFLFTNHLLITARTNNGRLRLVKNYGKIALIECTLVEDTSASLLNADDDGLCLKAFANTTRLLSGSMKRPTTTVLSDKQVNINQISRSIRRFSGPPLSEQTMGNVGRRSLEPFSPAARAPVPYSAPNNFATTPSKDSNSTTMVNMSGSQIGHKPPIRADSGPLTSGMASSRRITPSDNATRHSSGSALSSCPSGPTNRSWAGSTTGVPHRHSTSLCTAPTETDSGSRTGVGSTPDANVVNSLPTSSGFPNIPPVPLIHRLSSNFSMLSTSTATPINSSGNDKADYGNLDFRLIWEPKNGQPTSIWLVASTLQEKAAWCSDISQCIEQLHYGDILNSAQSDVSSVTMPQSVRSDPRLFKDDVDIKFSHTLNSCKVPQIRYATVDRLLDRLTDARFLSIDFLNTFLLTYRVFTTGLTVIWALKQVLANPEMEGAASTILLQNQPAQISINTSTLIYSPNVSQEGRSPSAFRFSDVAMPGRLPVLQEKLSLQEEDQLKDEESRPKTASQVPSTHSCLSELRLKAPIIKRRPFNLPSRPMSASESPNPASPEGTISASLLDSQRMSRSEINYGTEKDAKNSSGNLDATDLAGRPRTLSSCSSPPPLIPRSPIFSGIFNIRDDPPLQLPNLSELPTKRNSAKRESLPLSPLDNTTSDGVLSKGHTRLAPLASCELVTDDPEGTNTADRARDRSYSDVQNVDEAKEKAENVSNPESTRQRRRSHSAECFPVGFDRILLAESVCEGDSDKHIRIKIYEFSGLLSYISLHFKHLRFSASRQDAWDSTDSQLSPNNGNEPDPTSTPNPEIDTSRTNASRGIVATHKEFYDSLQSTERKLPCQVSQSDETHRLVENYLNQTIAPPCREHTNEGQKSTEPKVSSNTQHPASDRQADHNLPKNQSDASASLVVSSNPGIPVNLSPITEGLDLATKLIHEDRENKGACQTLAKSTMLAALRCPVGLVRIRQSEEKAQPKENPVLTMLNGNCTVHDTVQSSPSSPRNSHEPLSGQN
ncbi:Ras-specific guanine nucleotide-releasing factor 1, partial [Clonorchis sinensis]